MKHKISFCLFALWIALLAPSCSNFLLETSPNDLDATTAITDAAGAEAALLGCYSAFQSRYYYGGQYPLMAEALADNASTGGYSYLSLDQISNHNVTPANVLVESTWISVYRAIANCNQLLEALPGISDLAGDRKKAIEGQARALRALAHFDLFRYFGEYWNANSSFGIPVITKVQVISDRPGRNSVKDTYQAIFDDLNQAAALLPRDEAAPQYINLNTVNALLARLYLYQNNPGKAAEYATLVIDNPAYALLDAANYKSIFESRRTSESVFELSFDAQNRSDFNNLTYNRDEAIRPELSFMADALLNYFFQNRSGDVRAALLNFDPAKNDVTIIPDGRTQKYRGEASKDNPAYIVRLAEMYLIRAEANGRTAGLADLNKIRTQRGLPALADWQIPTDEAFLNAVLDERRAEFNFEGHRFFDLARTGLLTKVLGVEAFRSILPIPNRDILASGGVLAQSPGY